MSFLFQAVLALHACLLVVDTVLSAPATYDQRQTGNYNVRVDLKNLKILALVDSKILEDYTDYDYFYDYADFTVKPTTSNNKPTTSSSVEPWNTWPTNPPTSSSTTNKIGSDESVPPANDSTTPSSFLSSVEDTVTSLRTETSTESTKKSTVEDKTESTSNIEGIVETPKSLSTRGTTKWRSSNRSKFESPSG